jgi:hypothetical protein
MGGITSVVEDVVGGAVDIVESVGNAVADVGNTIMEEVVEPVVDTVDRTIQAAMEDPVGTAVKVAAISTGNPAIMAAANAAVAVANGADFEDAVVAAGKGYAASVIGGEIASGVAPELASSADLTAGQASTAANVIGQTAGAAATGGDPLSALVTGTIGAGAGAVASEIPGFEDLSKTQQAAISRAIALEAQGKDSSQALLNAAIGAGVNAAKDSSGEPVVKTAEEDVNDLITQLASAQPEETLTQQVNSILGIEDNQEAIPTVATTDEPMPQPEVVNAPEEKTFSQIVEEILNPEPKEDPVQNIPVEPVLAPQPQPEVVDVQPEQTTELPEPKAENKTSAELVEEILSQEPEPRVEEKTSTQLVEEILNPKPEAPPVQDVTGYTDNPFDASPPVAPAPEPLAEVQTEQTMQEFLESVGINPEILDSIGAPEEPIVEGVAPEVNTKDETPVTETQAPAEEDVLSFLTEKEQAATEPEPEPTAQDIYELIGIDPTTLSDMPAATEDPLAFLSTKGYYDENGKYVYDELGGLQAPLDDTSGTNLDSMEGYTTKDGVTTTPSGESYDLSYLDSSYTPLDTSKLAGTPTPDTSVGDMVTQFLNQNVLNKKALAGLGGLGAAAALGSSLLGGSSGSSGVTGEQPTVAIDPYTGQVVNWNQMTGSMDDQGVAYGLAQLSPQFSTVNAAQGGIMSLAGGGMTQSSLGGYAAGGNPRLLKGPGDGMSDNIPATISGKQPARLADGEFVVPADVVSHLGNGSTDAGANVLYQMMERVRKARTGNSKQGKQINPQKFIPRKGK